MDDSNKTFCTVPWVYTTHRPNGNFRLCCHSNEGTIAEGGMPENIEPITKHTKAFNWNTHTLKEYWNADAMKEARLKMLSGEKLDWCKRCYTEEESGKYSARNRSNDRYTDDEINTLVEQTSETGHTDKLPIQFDLKLGNLCNLKCRICDGISSSEILKETLTLQKKYPTLTESMPLLSSNKIYEGQNEEINSWVENPRVWEEIHEHLPNIRRLEATGGEPSLIKPLHDLLQSCVDKGYADNLEFVFVSNLTNIKPSFLDLIQQFKAVWACGSVDGYGDIQEYSRYPSNWDTIKKHMLTYANLEEKHGTSKFGFTVVCTVNMYTVLYLDKFLDFIIKNKMRINLNLLMNPPYLCVNILTDNLRQKAIERLEIILQTQYDVTEEYTHVYNQNIQNIKATIEYLHNNVSKDQKMIEQFNSYTNMLDKERNQNYFELCPEMKEMNQS